MALTQLLNESLQFIVFGGKDGVGKTTVAAATALELAKRKKVLIFSTDQTSSLTDTFDQAIGHEPTAIVGMPNLFAMEIDVLKVFQDFKKEHAKNIMEMLNDGTYLSKQEVENMFTLDLPGLEEVLSMQKIAEVATRPGADYQVYIIDTAPMGHTLRLLMLPELLDTWVKFIAGLRWKHRAVINVFAGGKRLELADKLLLELKQSIKKTRALLQNTETTEFVAVTLAEKMAIAEAEDLLGTLVQMHIPSRHIIVNNMFPQEAPEFTDLGALMRTSRSRTEGVPSAFPFFGSNLNLEKYLDFAEIKRKTQEKYVHEIEEKFSHHIITEILLQPTEIRGIDSLQQLGAYLFPGVEAGKS